MYDFEVDIVNMKLMTEFRVDGMSQKLMYEFDVDGMRFECSLTHVTKQLCSKHVARVDSDASIDSLPQQNVKAGFEVNPGAKTESPYPCHYRPWV